MKIENEVTGEISERLNNIIRVDIYLRGEKIDNFEIYLNSESISLYLEHNTDKFLGVENTYEGYMQLVKDLGLEMPSKWKKHWIPAEEWSYYSINQGGNVEGLESYEELSSARFRKENYNAFPTRDLAEKGKNLSKLGRLVLLWQYANDCIFETDWKDGDTKKYFIRYDYINEEVCHGYNVTIPSDTLYFETSEQVEAFIEMYETEIKKIMGVI